MFCPYTTMLPFRSMILSFCLVIMSKSMYYLFVLNVLLFVHWFDCSKLDKHISSIMIKTTCFRLTLEIFDSRTNQPIHIFRQILISDLIRSCKIRVVWFYIFRRYRTYLILYDQIGVVISVILRFVSYDSRKIFTWVLQ